MGTLDLESDIFIPWNRNVQRLVEVLDAVRTVGYLR